MDTKDKNPATRIALPAEYSHLENDIQQTAKQVREIDEQIKNVLKDRGPELNLTPHGYAKSRPIMSHDQVVQSLEHKRTQLKTDMSKMVNRDLEHADPKDTQLVQDYIREAFNPNLYAQMDEAEKQMAKGKSKDMEQSQDFMAVTIGDAKQKNMEKEQSDLSEKPSDKEQGRDIDESQYRMSSMTPYFKQKNNLEKENINPSQEPSKEEHKQSSISMRFTQSLSYTKAMENSDKNITPSKDKDTPDKD